MVWSAGTLDTQPKGIARVNLEPQTWTATCSHSSRKDTGLAQSRPRAERWLLEEQVARGVVAHIHGLHLIQRAECSHQWPLTLLHSPLTQTVSTRSPGGSELVGASAHSQPSVKTLLFKVCCKHTIPGFLRAKRTLCIIGSAINPSLSLPALASSNLLRHSVYGSFPTSSLLP